MINRYIKGYGQYIDPLYEAKLINGIYKLWPKINEESELSPTQIAYQELMTIALLKFGAESPADLDTQSKKDMFNWIKDNWDKDKGEASEEAKALIKKAKEKGLMNKEPMAAKSDAEKEKALAKKAEAKRKEVAKKLGIEQED